MPLPNFLVIGALKAGTSSLYHYLKEHPDVYMPDTFKEPRFFCYDGKPTTLRIPVTTLEDYQRLFDGVKREKAIGEASPHYLVSQHAPHQIKRILPKVRLIASIRNPVDRSYSTYLMNLGGAGRNKGVSFLNALREDPWLNHSYFEQFTRFYSLFPREQLNVILFDDLKADTRRVVSSIFRFLEVDDSFSPVTSVIHNRGGVPRNAGLDWIARNRAIKTLARSYLPKALTDTAKRLAQRNRVPSELSLEERKEALIMFRDDILRTQELIRLDLSEWLKI
jgi:hypothetical protein